MMTSDPRLARMILTYFNEDDFQRIEDHKTGDGVIGGKILRISSGGENDGKASS